MTRQFDLLTASTAGAMPVFSRSIQIRADGSVIEIVYDPFPTGGAEVKAGRLTKADFKPLESALRAMLSARSRDVNGAQCPAVIPDAPSSQITMIKDGQQRVWDVYECQIGKQWHTLDDAIKTAAAKVLRPVP